MSEYQVRPLKENEPRGWNAIVDGNPMTVGSLTIENQRIGLRFDYGMRPEGYDGVIIHERGEGVAVYGVPFDEEELEPVDDEYMFPHGTVPLDNSKLGEKIITTRFKPIERVMQLKDMFSVVAGGLIISHLAQIG